MESDSEEEYNEILDDECEYGEHDIEVDHSQILSFTEMASCNIDYQFLESLKPIPSERFTDDEVKFLIMDIFIQSNYKNNTTEGYIFGREYETGLDICVIVEGWQPFFYVRAPINWRVGFHNDSAFFSEMLSSALERNLCHFIDEKEKNGTKKKQRKIVYGISIVQKKSIYGFSPEGLSDFIKIEFVDTWGLRHCKNFLEGYFNDGDNCWVQGHTLQIVHEGILMERNGSFTEIFDGEVDPIMQFMVDLGIYGCQWCSIKDLKNSENVEVVEDTKSNCNMEIRVHKKCLIPISMDEMNDLGKIRILSFDIEAAGRRGVFPEAQVDPVIQIAIHFLVLGDKVQKKPILLCLKKCELIDGVDVFSFDSELEMLNAFRDIVAYFNTDIFTGYNICNFDFPYLQKRARVLECQRQCIEYSENWKDAIYFEQMTRFPSQNLKLRETVFQSVQTGKRKRTRVSVLGRVCLDMITYIQNNQSFRLEKYTLNAVSEYFLGDHKVDIPFTQITPMWEKDSFSRAELGKYCVKDAELPISLMLKTDALTQVVEIARSTGIPFDWVLQRGIMIRNTRLLLERALLRQFIFPNISIHRKQRNGNQDIQKYEGATVLDAQAGIHKNVGVLDFSAMYPSIIRAHNLCYSTIVLNPELIKKAKHLTYAYNSDENEMKKQGGDEYWFRMNKHTYVPSNVQKGLIPEVVEFLQNCRNKAKKAYAIETDPTKKKICKAREMAFKVAGNGMYGSLGSTQSLLPLLAIAETVTAIGRSDIQKVKSVAENMYKDCFVVYGDTDSVFVRFNVPIADTKTMVTKTSEMAIALSERVNTIMKLPKKIEFEKVYSTMLCLSKKRYAGIMYASDHKWENEPPVDIKGMQCVRRDGCGLTRDLVRNCLISILNTGNHVDAVTIARKTINDIFEDKIEVEQYAIRKVLRKSMQDCCHPMTRSEIAEIRGLIHSDKDKSANEQLSYAEQDEAIRKNIKLPWNLKVRLPHVLLAWRMRLKDPGSAPVLGESITYIVTNNGGKQVFEKVETLEHVKNGKQYMIDRKYYLEALRVPLENIFLPIYCQLLANSKERAVVEFNKMIWNLTKNRPFSCSAEAKNAKKYESPIAKAFGLKRSISDV